MESENSSNEDILLSRNHVTEKNLNKPPPSKALQQSLKIDNIDDLLFRNPSLINSTNFQAQSLDGVVDAEVLINQKKSHHLHEHNKKLSKINTCKGLQRKLELKVERAKRNFNAHSNEKFNQLENNIVSFLIKDFFLFILLYLFLNIIYIFLMFLIDLLREFLL